jgi:hypothetical protein
MEESKKFNFQKFIEDSKNALLNPKEYFANLETKGGLVEPLIKAIIYGAIAGLFTMIWSYMYIGGGSIIGGAFGFGAFIMSIVGAVIGAFIGGVVVLILSAICSGSTDYEANFRVAVSLMVIFPISAFLNVLGGISSTLSTIVSLAINLYALYMLFFGLTLTLKGKEQSAKVMGYVLGGILVFFIVIGLATRQVAKRVTGYGSKRIERKLEEMQKAAEKMADEMAAKYEEIEEAMDEETEETSGAVDKYLKPEEFPSLAAEKAVNWISKDNSIISVDMLENLVKATEALREFDKSQQEEMAATLLTFGYDDPQKYAADYIATISGFQAIKGMEAMEIMMKSSEQEQKVAQVFTLDQMLESMVKQPLTNGKLTMDDLHTIYNNWDLSAKIYAYSDK